MVLVEGCYLYCTKTCLIAITDYGNMRVWNRQYLKLKKRMQCLVPFSQIQYAFLKLDHVCIQESRPSAERSTLFDPTTSEKQQLVYKLSLGERHIVTGTCTSKKEGQRLGAQAMLKVSITDLFRQRVQVWLCHL